jgi:hypothetical protein
MNQHIVSAKEYCQVHFRVSHLNSLGSKNWNPKRNRKRDALNKEQSLEKRAMPLNAKKG